MFLGSNGLSCFISICKFGSLKNPFATITSLSELYFRRRNFTLLVQTKEVISMSYGSRTSSWKPWRWARLDLIFCMRDIYINSNLNPLRKFTSSGRRIKLKGILPWNISQMITKTIPISTKIVISYAMKRLWNSCCEFDGKSSMETEITTWSEYPNVWKATVEKILASQ